MKNKHNRLKRGLKTRIKIRELNKDRLTIFKTSRHIYAQIISSTDNKVLACVNTLQKVVQEQTDYTGNVKAAELVGKLIAEKAQSIGVTEVAFDRSGFKYHGRIKALADSARTNGLIF